MIKQRLYGLGLVLAGVASVLPTGDATAALPLVGLGAWMMCSKRSLLYAPWGIPGRGGRRVSAARRRKNKKSAPAVTAASAHTKRIALSIRKDIHSIAHSERKVND